MKQWIVVKFTGLSVSAKAGDVTIWADHGDIAYDSPAYEVVYRTPDFKEAQFIARHERMHRDFKKYIASEQGA